MKQQVMTTSEHESAAVLLASANAEQDYGMLYRLIQIRVDRGLTQTDVARKLGVSQQAISQFESMDSNPALSTIRSYALAVGATISHTVSPSSLFELE